MQGGIKAFTVLLLLESRSSRQGESKLITTSQKAKMMIQHVMLLASIILARQKDGNHGVGKAARKTDMCVCVLVSTLL